MTDLPRVALWADQTVAQGPGNDFWGVVGDLPAYESLDLQVRYNDTGTWQMSLPYDVNAAKVDTEQLVTFDWRGLRLMTGVITSYERSVNEEGNPILNLAGLDGLAYIGYSIAWPQPDLPMAQQHIWPSNPGDAPPIRDVASAAVLTMIRNNLTGRRAQNLVVAPATGIGTTVSIRPAFDNLLTLSLQKATRGGIGLKAVMESAGTDGVNSTVGTFTIRCYAPTDRSVRIVFDEHDGSVASWTRRRAAPTASNVVVSGVQGKYRRVGRNATGWNPTREQFTQGPASYDDTELDGAADEALDAGEPTVNISVVAAETPRQQAFVDFNVGDTCTAVLGAQTLVDVITAIGVKVDENGPAVTPVFGDPDGIDPRDGNNRLLRRTRRDVDQQKRRT